MKIKEVTIHNFKSISQDCPLTVDTKITPLVGASETGKTNILIALNKFFATGAFDESDICSFSEPLADESYMISVTFKLEDFDKEEVAKIDERIVETGEFTLPKRRNGQYVLEESGLPEGKPKEPQPPSRLTEVHDIIRQGLERANALLGQFSASVPEAAPEHQAAHEALSVLIEHMPLSGFPTQPNDTEEQEFLKTGGDLLSTLSVEIDRLPNVPEELKATITDLQSKIVEAASLPYEVPPKQEIDPKQLLELCPHTLYIKDADVQLLPDSIPISKLEAGAEQASTYQTLLRIAGLTPGNLKDTNVTRRERKLGNGAENINKFLKRWTQEKLEARFVVAQDNLLLHITGKEGHFGNVSDRSEGFRWFLSFCLSYGSPVSSSRGSLLLLDEPGLHLHASAQKDLLELFESMAQTCQILYTTHSPFMINKNYPERIRGVFKNERPEGTAVDNKPYRPTKGGYYEPIRSSIGITLGNSLFIGGCNLVVEGIADQIILTAFSRRLAKQDNLPFIDLQHICITPAGGADNVPYFAYLCNVEHMKPVVLLDNDGEGETAFLRIQKEQVIPPERIIRVREATTKDKEKIIELEDLIDHEFYHTAFLDAYRELPKLEFVEMLPQTFREMEEQLSGTTVPEVEKETGYEADNAKTPSRKATSKSGSGKTTKKNRGEPKGTTVIYSQLFKEHEDEGWGHFDKVLVARKISQKLEDGDIVDDKTNENFKNLFKIINDKFKENGAV